METVAWLIGSNIVTAFVVWRLMAFYAHRLPAVLDRLNGSKMHEYLDQADVDWITAQLREDPTWLRRQKTSSATTGGQGQ